MCFNVRDLAMCLFLWPLPHWLARSWIHCLGAITRSSSQGDRVTDKSTPWADSVWCLRP